MLASKIVCGASAGDEPPSQPAITPLRVPNAVGRGQTMMELNVIRLFNGIKDVNLLLFLKFTILAVLLVLVGASVPHTLAATTISFGVSSSVNGSHLNGM